MTCFSKFSPRIAFSANLSDSSGPGLLDGAQSPSSETQEQQTQSATNDTSTKAQNNGTLVWQRSIGGEGRWIKR